MSIKSCFVCLDPVSHQDKNGNSVGGRKEKDSWRRNSVKILISYILQNSSRNSERDQLQMNISSSFENERISVCFECLSKAEHLLRLHLELEKIQMQILDILRNLQNCLTRKSSSNSKLMVVGDIKDDLGLSRFQDVLQNEFICRGFFDKAQLRLERLNIAGYGLPVNSSSILEDLSSSHKNKMNLVKEEPVVIVGGVECSDVKLFFPQLVFDPEPELEDDVGIKEVVKQPTNSRKALKRKKNASPQWECDICLEDIPPSDMETHLKTHQEFEKFYSCDICPHKSPKRVYGTYKGLVWHYFRKSHHVQLPCELCPDSKKSIMYSRGLLCRHLYEVHHPNHKKLQCKRDNCKEEFNNPQSLKTHRWRQHSEEGSPPKRKKVAVTTNENVESKKDDDDEEDYCPEIDIRLLPDTGAKKKPTIPKKEKIQKASCFWDCDICLEDIPSSEMETHLKSHPEFENFYTCDLCPEKSPKRMYGTYKGLVWHYFKAYHHVQLPCKLCPDPDQSILFTRGQLCKHLYEIHHPNHKKLQCKNADCSHEFFDPQSRRSHQWLEHSRGFTCDICQQSFKVKKYLDRHVRRVHKKTEEIFWCASCPKSFRNKINLRTHELNRHERELQKCPHCSKMFPQNAFKEHLRIHGEKKFHCQFCTKSFTSPFYLKSHEELHTNGKKFMCSECPYMGKSKDSLRNHMRTHEEKTLKCQYCPMVFRRKFERDNHHHTHTNERPYKCELCDAAFMNAKGRTVHRRKLHGIAPVDRTVAEVGVGKMQSDSVVVE